MAKARRGAEELPPDNSARIVLYDAMAEAAWHSIPPDVMEEARGFLAWSDKTGRSTYGLSEKTFLVCDSLKRMWRAANPAISSYWRELRDVAIAATNTPGKTYDCRRLKIRRDGAWLKIKLPSNRYLCYPSPRIEADGALSYLGTNPYTRKWCRLHTYGGKLFENSCQSLAGDVMKANMPAIEAAGYEIILTVHDEVAVEAPGTEAYSVDGLSGLLATAPSWAPGLPLAAGGFENYRYRKG